MPGRGAVQLWAAVCLLLASGCARNGYRLVRPAVAFEMLRDSPELTIIDLRSRAGFSSQRGHIRGALNVPLEELVLSLDTLDDLKETAFLVYCDDPSCAEEGIDILRRNGFRYPFVIAGGIDAWIDEGFGTDRAATPTSEEVGRRGGETDPAAVAPPAPRRD